MDPELIDSNIQVIASGLDRGIPEKEIIEAYITAGFNMADITLLLAAAKIIHHDRKTAVPVKGVFKRVT